MNFTDLLLPIGPINHQIPIRSIAEVVIDALEARYPPRPDFIFGGKEILKWLLTVMRWRDTSKIGIETLKGYLLSPIEKRQQLIGFYGTVNDEGSVNIEYEPVRSITHQRWDSLATHLIPHLNNQRFHQEVVERYREHVLVYDWQQCNTIKGCILKDTEKTAEMARWLYRLTDASCQTNPHLNSAQEPNKTCFYIKLYDEDLFKITVRRDRSTDWRYLDGLFTDKWYERRNEVNPFKNKTSAAESPAKGTQYYC